MKFAWFSKSKPSKHAKRGFTLVELMAASTGALFITVGVYAFTRNVTDFFQRQMRLSDATMNAVTGFERLRTDIQRAAFLSSPNLARDHKKCPRPPSGASTAPTQVGAQLATYVGLQRMALARLPVVTAGDYPDTPMLKDNAGGIIPDQLILYGNYTSTEQFPVKVALPAANQIVLDVGSVAMRRLGITGAATDVNILADVFKPGSILRVVDAAGRHQYAVLADPSVNLTTDSQGDVTLFLNPAVQLITKEGASGGTCGIRGGGSDLAVNPVNIVRYRLADLAGDANFAALFAADLATPSYDDTRLDLIREELSPVDESVLAGTTELIAEYGVDLKFGLTVNDDLVLGGNTYIPEDDPNLMNFADVPFGTASGGVGGFGPHLIRGIHARLAVRTREAEYSAPLLPGAAAALSSGSLYRIKVSDSNEYASLRSLRAHIATRNSRGERW